MASFALSELQIGINVKITQRKNWVITILAAAGIEYNPRPSAPALPQTR